MTTLTPGMKQYMNIKNANPDCIILFRMGDFYETFFEDAKTISRELEITLTSRGKDEKKAPLAGIPYHAIEPYIAKLIKKGYKVGIVEQTENPKYAKGLVKRELVRIITPGTTIESDILKNSLNNYILSLTKKNEEIGISFCDISTGEFLCCKLNEEKFLNELKRINPAEIIFPESLAEDKLIKKIQNENFRTTPYEERFFWKDWAKEILKEHFNVLNLEGFGINSELEISTAGSILSYLKETQKKSLKHIQKIQEYKLDNLMHLDSSAIRNLELTKNILGSEEATLLNVIDKTTTPMGKRLIRKWITSPLIKKEKIEKRLETVNELKKNLILRDDISKTLKKVYDIERLIGRVSYGNSSPRDLIALKISLQNLPRISFLLEKVESKTLREIAKLPDLSYAMELIKKSIKDEPATITREGNIIKEGYNSELDELRNLSKNIKNYLAELEEKEKERTKIKSLKIKYNKVIGYFIEVTKSNLNLVPEDYIRRQTQINSERFITEDLKEKESKILGAQERIYTLEYEIFCNIIEELRKFITPVQETAKKIAKLDCLTSFATISEKNNYCYPELNKEGHLEIKEGRHPVIEEFSEVDFISNNCQLNNEKRTIIITGPNMAGKSTILRQNAIISLMAQIGCFVPATSAKLPIFDRIFCRIGAHDNLVNQQSTFMIEMNETANILNNATKNSLVILDEIGRGTSTFDGVSLAWAITEFLNNEIKCKTLFATHYHHLNNMEKLFSGIENYNIAVEEINDKIIFLRKLMKGGTDKSYGIQVAKLAGVPEEVIKSAEQVMSLIEDEDNLKEKIIEPKKEKTEIIEEEIKMFEPEQIQQDTTETKEIQTTITEIDNDNQRINNLESELEEIKRILKERF